MPAFCQTLEECGSKLLAHGSFEEMTMVVEAVVGRNVDGEETLRRAGWLEHLLFALAPSIRLIESRP